MQNKANHLQDDEKPSLLDRLGTAILAPIAFNFSIIIVLSLIFSGARKYILYFKNPVRLLYGVPGNYLLLVSIILPAIIGFMLGMNRFTTLYGHFFYTNSESERSISMTVFVWAMLLLMAYILSAMGFPF
ncbi:hypothetical protein [Methylotenera mobilis]|uniref:hypothetical protein n=1 Tax=Methylotenera mobilis TaxID=359408 RepID=UPI00035EFFE2|nr:hypothetical protein [Methylotenera mobilis]PPC96444.1 MAG: hypothetical protein CTY32_05405 [Methylotenera sp.]